MILAVLVLEAVVAVALDVLEKFRALRRRHRAVVLVVGPNERRHDDVARGPEGKDMAGGGRGGPVIIPHPDNDDAGCLLDDVGSTNANDDDNDDTPPPPPENDGDAPRGEGGRDDNGAG